MSGRPSDTTLKSAAPDVRPVVLPTADDALVISGGTLVELHPPRMGKADVLIAGGSIVQVGGDMPGGIPHVDASGCFVTPAFTNAHTHLYMSLSCGMPPPPSQPRTLADVLQSVWWALDKALDDDLVHTAALVGAANAAKAGAAVVIDHHSSPRAIEGSLDRVEAALDEVGIRGVLCYETSDRDGRGRRDGGLRENRRFLDKVRAGRSRHRALVGAHAPMTLNDDTLDALRDLATSHEVGIHIHVAEDLTDHLDAERIRNTSLSERLRRLGLARKGTVVAHGVQLDPESAAEITDAGGWVATTTRSNMAHAVGVGSLASPRVALGTDGVDGDMLGEARAHFYRHTEARDGLARDTLARIVAGQRMSAELFGEQLAEELGAPSSRIVRGARADLLVVEYEPMTPMTPSNLIDHVVRGWRHARVRDNLVGGKHVVRDGVLVHVDERELTQRARAAAGRLWERMHGYY
ncbi:MAG: amidohydrolase family protein [Myxococcales bacterium]|nr:amidohydrolase family protein [Myxococcales bacterium]